MLDLPPNGLRPLRCVTLLLATVLVAACGASPEGSGSPPPPGAPGVSPAAAGSGASADAGSSAAAVEPSAAPAAPGGFLDPAVLTACLDLTAEACSRARDLAATAMAAGDPPARYVQVGPFGCAAGEACPGTLEARPEGEVMIEFDGGHGIAVQVKVAADGSFETTRAPAPGVSVAPTSAVGIGAGPLRFTLGHCGIYSGIDVDGSWWDPVGPVATASGDAVNATAGLLTFTDPNHAIFTAPSGFALQLQRRAGPKLLPFCM